MSQEAQQLMYDKNTFYRDHYRRTLRWVVYMAVVSVALSLILGYLILDREQPAYYATTTSGQVVPMHALSEPVITQSYLLQWASMAVRRAYNMDFDSDQAQLNQAKPYFTTGGWTQFLAAMKSSGLLGTIQKQKLVMSAVVSGDPVITDRGVYNGRFMWRVQLPLLVSFVSANEHEKSHMIVTINIARVPTLDAAKGIQITDFQAKNNNYG